jgi:RNA polymerase sigma-70 factor (ECF subfamily)
MHTTPVSLLDRLRQPAGQEAWGRFVELYTPLLFYWARRLGLQEADAADLVQDVLLQLYRKLPDFTYDRQGSFRGWLRTLVLNKWREKQRRPPLPLQATAALEDVAAARDDFQALDEAEYRQHLAGRALRLMQADFPPAAWKSCWETVVAGRRAADVAAELGTTAAAVRVAKARVLHRLRLLLQGLLD